MPLGVVGDILHTEAPGFLSKFSQLCAAETDFGGYAGPAGSLLLIAFLILTLAPPLEQKETA
jgi:hypothetical protein